MSVRLISGRLLRGVGVLCGMSALGVSIYSLHQNDYDLSSIGAMRLGRAAQTVGCIFVDYKYVMWGADRSSEEYANDISDAHTRSANRLLRLACANGGVWIKVGQHLGAMEYILPPEYTTTMRVLHSKAPVTQYNDICKVIRQDLRAEADDIFLSFDPVPLGAASVAQVHKATLTDGTPVAVKVQHPRVKPNSFVDIATMEFLVNCADKLFPDFRLMWLVDQMKKNLPLELDFINEGKNQDTVRRMFGHFDWLKVPEIYWNLSSERVLVMEFCEGGFVNDAEYMKTHSIQTSEVCNKLAQLYSEMIFVTGYVHCDPHPGNILVTKDGNNNTQLILLDHGLYTTLREDFRLYYSNLWLSLLSADLDGIKHWADKLGVGDLYGLFACMLTKRSWKSVADGNINKTKLDKGEREEIQLYVGSLLPQISDVLARIPRPMILILKTNDLLRSIEASLGVSGNSYTWTQMSRFCVLAIHNDAYKHCNTFTCKLTLTVTLWFRLARIYLYETALAIANLFGVRAVM